MKERIRHFPITSFAMVMGLTGLTIALSKAYHLQWLPKAPFDFMLFVDLGLFSLFTVLYGWKCIIAPDEVSRDFRHPIRINFFATVSISLLLLSIAFYAYWPVLAVSFWWTGVLLQTLLALHTMTFWVQHNFEIHHCNPAWFIPVVGNILVPIVGVDFAPRELCFFYFAVGLFFWLVLFAIMFYRIIFHPQLPAKFVPTFFILIAPPAVGFISYMRLTMSWDLFSLFLLSVAYFFVLLLVFMHRSFTKLTYFLSWWAFTFPLAAVTIASMVAYQATGSAVFRGFAWLLFAATAGMVAIVSWRTAAHALRGEICVEEK
jgi:tellurite resistance protein